VFYLNGKLDQAKVLELEALPREDDKRLSVRGNSIHTTAFTCKITSVFFAD
jgi:hypothetical protein